MSHLIYLGQHTLGWTPSFCSNAAGTGTNSNLEHRKSKHVGRRTFAFLWLFTVYKHKQINVLPLCAVAVLKELEGTRSVHLRVELAPISGGGGGCSIRWRGHRYDRGGRDENKNENYRYLKAMVKMVQHCLCHLAHFFLSPTLQFQRGSIFVHH